MDITVHPLSLSFVQAYLIETPGSLFLVDTGMPGNEKTIMAAVQALSPRPLKLILITHAHADHTGSAAALKRLTGAQVAIHPLDAEAMAKAKMPARGRSGLVRLVLGVFTRFIRLQPLQADILLEDGASLAPYGLPGQVFLTPGHTPGSLTLLLEDGSGFVGDLVSTNGQPHLQSRIIDDWEQLRLSYQRLRDLCGQGLQQVYVGHGQRSLTGAELVALIDTELPSLRPPGK